jgi:hypothetical protein
LNTYLMADSASNMINDLKSKEQQIIGMFQEIQEEPVLWVDIVALFTNLSKWVDDFKLIDVATKKQIKKGLGSSNFSVKEDEIKWYLTPHRSKRRCSIYQIHINDDNYSFPCCMGIDTVADLHGKLLNMLLHVFPRTCVGLIAMLFENTLIRRKNELRLISIRERNRGSYVIHHNGRTFYTDISDDEHELSGILIYLWGLMKESCTENDLIEFACAILKHTPTQGIHLDWIIFPQPSKIFKDVNTIDKLELVNKLTEHHYQTENTSTIPDLGHDCVLSSSRNHKLYFKMHDTYAMFYFASALDTVTLEFVTSADRLIQIPILKFTGAQTRPYNSIYFPYTYCANSVHYIKPKCVTMLAGLSYANLDTCLGDTVNIFQKRQPDPSSLFCPIGFTFNFVLNLCHKGLPSDFREHVTPQGELDMQYDRLERHGSFSRNILQHVNFPTFFQNIVSIGLKLWNYHALPGETDTERSTTVYYSRDHLELLPPDNVIPDAQRYAVAFYFKALGNETGLFILQSIMSDDTQSVANTDEADHVGDDL